MSDHTEQALDALRGEERGQTMAEYAVVLALITLAIVGAFSALSSSIIEALGRISAYL